MDDKLLVCTRSKMVRQARAGQRTCVGFLIVLIPSCYIHGVQAGDCSCSLPVLWAVPMLLMFAVGKRFKEETGNLKLSIFDPVLCFPHSAQEVKLGKPQSTIQIFWMILSGPVENINVFSSLPPTW